MNKNVKKVNFYYSDFFKKYVMSIMSREIPSNVDLLFAYFLLVKSKNFVIDYVDLANVLDTMKAKDKTYNLLKNSDEVSWAIKFYESKHVLPSAKTAFTDVLMHNYVSFSQ